MSEPEKDPRDMTAREIVAEAERLERRLKVLRRMAKYLEELDQADSGEPADD